MRQTYKFRLYKNHKNKHLYKSITVAGKIWNHCIAFQRTYFRLFGKYCHKYTLSKHISILRRKNKEWQIIGAQAVQKIIERLDNSYKRFFKWIKTKKGQKYGRPGFKESKKYSSFTMGNQNGWRLFGANKIRIGNYNHKFVKSREIHGIIKTVTIKRDKLNRLWICFSVLDNDFIPSCPQTSNVVGCDFGMKTFLSFSNNSEIHSPLFFKKFSGKITNANKRLSSKKKGSNNRKKAKLTLTRTYEKIVNCRRDWFFKLSHELCSKFQILYFEDLDLEAMKKLWGKKIGDLSFDSFLTILEHVAFKRGCKVIKIGRFEPTTKTCSQCGNIQNMPLSVRIFSCGRCGLSIGRDLNAAINIKRLGHQANRLGSVRRALSATSV